MKIDVGLSKRESIGDDELLTPIRPSEKGLRGTVTGDAGGRAGGRKEEEREEEDG